MQVRMHDSSSDLSGSSQQSYYGSPPPITVSTNIAMPKSRKITSNKTKDNGEYYLTVKITTDLSRSFQQSYYCSTSPIIVSTNMVLPKSRKMTHINVTLIIEWSKYFQL